MYLDEIRLHAQNLLTVLSSIFNIVGRTLWPFNKPENLCLRESYALEKLWGKWLQLQFEVVYHLTLIAWFISYEKWG